MVGPDYQTPVSCMPNGFIEERVDQTEERADENLAHWWTAFNDPFLNELLDEALQANFDLGIALEKVCQARAAFWVQFTDLLPEIEAAGQATRSRTSQSLTTSNFLHIPPIQSFYQVGFDAIWEIDIFGGLRRAARAAHASWEATAEDARNIRIVVLSEVAITYANICALQQTVVNAAQTVRLDEEVYSLATERFQAGLTNLQEQESALATLEGARADLLTAQTSLKKAIYSLGVLLGRPPESVVEQFEVIRPIPYASGKVPLGLPAELLRRRPDIRSAERQLAAATENIGVAVAELFPKFSLTGSTSSFSSNPLQGANVGFVSNMLSKLFTAPSRIWGIGGLVSLPLFDFGQRLATIKEYSSLEHQALFTYEKTVITALQEVESDLASYFNEEERMFHLSREMEASQKAWDLVLDLYQAGLANYTQVLQTEQVWLNAINALTSSQQALATDLISLYKALGGGWECSYMP